MPIKPVTARPVKVRGKWMFSVIIPLSLTGGVRKTRYFTGRSKADEFARGVEIVRAARIGGYDFLGLQDRAKVSIALSHVNNNPDDLIAAAREYEKSKPDRTATVAALASECSRARAAAHASAKYVTSLDNTFRRFCERFGERQADKLNAAEIQDWLNSNGWGQQTKQGYLKDIRTLLNFGLKRRYLTENPALAVERPKVTRKPPCILTPEDVERLMRAAELSDPGLLPYLALILFGGLRPEESYRCRWEYVKADVIDLPAGKSKNNKRRLVELASPALATLQAWLDKKGDMPPVNMRKRLDAVRAATAIWLDGPVPPVAWGHDILRHSFVSYSVPIHGVKETSLMADHSETVLNRHYRELVPRSAAEKFWRILPC